MLKKSLSIVFIVLMFVLCALFLIPHDKTYKVDDVISPVSFVLNGKVFVFKDVTTFDSAYTLKNSELAKQLKITEDEAYILGHLGKYWASNLMKGRDVYIKNGEDLIYLKYSYYQKFLYSGFCIKDSKPYFQEGFDKKLKEIRRAKYQVLDLETERVYQINDKEVSKLKNYILIRKSHLSKKSVVLSPSIASPEQIFEKGKIKVFFADSTTKLKPDRNCSSSICREILTNINNSRKSVDMAIYGYSRVPVIEKALSEAMKRGVKIRLVYDLDSTGRNIYPNTDIIVKLLSDNVSDKISSEAGNIMHNKFYIFDDKTLITGSANLSHTDMSGFNSNSIVVIESEEAAKIYKTEFEQMYAGNFHNAKVSQPRKEINLDGSSLRIYFSPQDRSITNAVLPLIKNAKNYIYMPTFMVTEPRVMNELINAKNRGVDVKLIVDALNASNKVSKHQLLRNSGVLVKTENYAGKMHSKSIIIDDEYTIIGSMNFSKRGETKNDENLIVIKDRAIAKFYKEFFLYQWQKIDDKWLKYNARAEGKDSIGSCEDGLDNNYDGLTDKNDPACRGSER